MHLEMRKRPVECYAWNVLFYRRYETWEGKIDTYDVE